MVSSGSVASLEALRLRLRAFGKVRDWGPFHTPKNLALALSVEVGELLECFLWLRDDEEPDTSQLREEIADVLLYLVMLADSSEIDLLDAASDKLALNEQRYPVERSKGSAAKYSDI